MTANASFSELFELSLKEIDTRPGDIVEGDVIAITSKFVVVSAGFKSEAMIPRAQFENEKGTLEVEVGDRVEVALDSLEDGFGATILSRDKAKKMAEWKDLETLYEAGETIVGRVAGRVKGGFTVEIGALKGFLPGSLVDVRPVRDTSYLDGKDIEIKVIKMDKRRNNVVVSRRAVMEAENKEERVALLERLDEGAVVKGIVKNLTDYGAFVDLGGVDGLLHITDMSWKRIKHPSEIVNVGDEIEVKVLKYDRERNRVSLGLKQMGEDPWMQIEARYAIGTKHRGKVSNITDYGCFVELEAGVEGLVHVSEMDWTNKNVNPNKVVQLGDDIGVMVLEIDEERRRISLGIKQCHENPWARFADKHSKAEHIKGVIKSITDFGIFIGLDGGIDGLVHLSDISWDKSGEEAVHEYTKGQEIETIILAIDPERERISLGIKQLEQTPYTQFTMDHEKGVMVKGKVISVESEKAIVQLADEVQGHLKAADVASEKVENIHDHIKVGDEIEARIAAFDHKNRAVLLSMKPAEAKSDKTKKGPKTKTSMSEQSPTATLGDIFKEQLESKTDAE